MTALSPRSRILGSRPAPVEVQVQLSAGLPRFTIVGPARQGGRREQGARSRRPGVDRPRAPAEADHGQSLTHRPSEGRVALRPSDCVVPAGRDRCCGCGDAVALCRRWGAEAGRPDCSVTRRAAGGDPGFVGKQRPYLPGIARGGSRMGRRRRSGRRAGPAFAPRAPQGHVGPDPAAAGRSRARGT